MFQRNFLFGSDACTANVINVYAEDLYQPGKGYGFVIEENRREQELLKVSELNSAFAPIYWYQDADLSHLEEDENGCFLDSDRKIKDLEEMTGETYEGEKRRIPLSFKVDVPAQGNYKVTVTIKTVEPMENVFIFTGRRRLGYKGDIPANTTFTHTMIVNVCDIVPRGYTEVYEDTTLDITVVADKPRLTGLTVEAYQCPTVYIGGDSTVTDQAATYPYTPGTSYSGWGQMISGYFNEAVAVSNHAHSGLTTESYRNEGHYAITEKYSKAGDYYLFQFAHNDQKLDHLKANEGYRNNFVRYINECREKGIHPLIVTPIARNTWKGDGTYNDLLEKYADECIAIGKEMNVPVLDLHKLSMDLVMANGLEASKVYYAPGDYTHSNDYGAYLMAAYVSGELVKACKDHTDPAYRFLADCVLEGFGEWALPERIVVDAKPKIFENMTSPAEAAKLLSDVENLEEPADRASVLDMLIKTARFFPTNVYNDMFTDVVGHEWYAGTVECAYQNGIIDMNMVENGEFHPLQSMTLEEFLVFGINAYMSRKALPLNCRENAGNYDDKCQAFAKPYVRAAAAVGLIPKDGSADLNKVITRGEAVEYCRAMKI